MPESNRKESALDIWVVSALVVILSCIVFSVWRQVSFSIVASIACVAVFILAIAATEVDVPITAELAFMPDDLTEPSRAYTILTSMFMHTGFTHLFVNLFVLVLFGAAFEQRIGTRPYIVLYLVAGLVGTLAFAAVRWNEPGLSVVGASGAITGILGAFARLYPNEKIMMFPFPIPMSIWTFVLLFLLAQFLLLLGEFGIAVEAHVGGLVAGVLLAPLVVRLRLGQKTRVRGVRTISVGQLRALATTAQLKSMLDRIEHEEVPDVRSAWIEHFLSKAKCPHCGSRLVVGKESILCEKGHII